MLDSANVLSAAGRLADSQQHQLDPASGAYTCSFLDWNAFLMAHVLSLYPSLSYTLVIRVWSDITPSKRPSYPLPKSKQLLLHL